MDILSALPPEIAYTIFCFLSIKDLFNCMTVCKSWREIINNNYIWKHFYKVLDIEEIEEKDFEREKGALAPLCSRALEVRDYTLSRAYKWRKNECRDINLPLEYRRWKFACCEPFFCVLYSSVNKLDIYLLRGHGLCLCTRQSFTLPPNSVEQQILMNHKYIVFGSYNITYVFKVDDYYLGSGVPNVLPRSAFELYRCFAMECNPPLLVENSHDNHDCFVEEHIRISHPVYDRVLIDDTLWITDPFGNKHIIDLNTGKREIFYSNFLRTKGVRHSRFVLNSVNVNIQITDHLGAVMSSFSVLNANNVFYMNSNIVATAYPRVVTENKFPIECREIATGDLIRSITVQEQSRVSLHPMKDIFFFLSTPQHLYRVSSYCITSGTYLWTYEVPSVPHLFWGSYLSTIGNRYLFVYPSPSSDDCYALFDLRGKLLHQSPFAMGIILYFSESLIISSEEGRLHITQF